MDEFRVRQDWRGMWGVQRKSPGAWFWRWHGPFGITSTRWLRSDRAIEFANFCERYDRKRTSEGDAQ